MVSNSNSHPKPSFVRNRGAFSSQQSKCRIISCINVNGTGFSKKMMYHTLPFYQIPHNLLTQSLRDTQILLKISPF